MTGIQKTLCAALAAFMFSGTASAMKIEGRVTGVPDGIVLTLFQQFGSVGSSVLSDTLKKGRFSFSVDTLTTPLSVFQIACIPFEEPNRGMTGSCNLWVNPQTDVTIAGKGTNLSTWKIESNVPEQQIQNRLDEAMSPDYARMQTIPYQNSTVRDSLSREASRKAYPILLENANSVPALAEIQSCARFESLTPEQLKALYEKFTPANLASPTAEAIRLVIDPPVQVGEGDQFADFPAFDLQGVQHRLSDYVGKGKYVMLDFWSYGCGPCRMAVPEMKEFYEKYGDCLEIIGCSLDTAKKIWEDGSQKGFPWPNLSDGSGNTGRAALSYGVQGIPHYTVIDPSGKIVLAWSGYAEGIFDEKVAPLLDSLRKTRTAILGKTDLPDGTKLHLYRYSAVSGSPIQRGEVANGKFSFAMEQSDSLAQYGIVSFDEGFDPVRSCRWWARPGEVIRIEAQGKEPDRWTTDCTHPEKIAYDAFSIVTPEIIADSTKCTKATWESIRRYSHTTAAAQALYQLACKNSSPKDTIRALQAVLSPTARNSFFGKGVEAKLNPPKQTAKVGKRAPDFTAGDPHGAQHHLSEEFNQGKYVLLCFWYSSCSGIAQCEDAASAYPGRLTTLTMTAIDERWAWLAGMEYRLNTPGCRYWSDGGGYASGAAVLYDVREWPVFWLINPKGKIVDRWTLPDTDAEFTARLSRWVGEPDKKQD